MPPLSKRKLWAFLFLCFCIWLRLTHRAYSFSASWASYTATVEHDVMLPPAQQQLVVQKDSLPYNKNMNMNKISSTTSAEPCRILLENKVDFHYEVIESTALRFPLPWDDLDCKTTSEIPSLVDVALAPPWAVSDHSEKADWESYFTTYLQGKVVQRKAKGDDHHRLVQFGNLVDLGAEKTTKYHAMVGVTCDTGYSSFKNWLKSESHHAYCVMHLACHNNATAGIHWNRVNKKYRCGPKLQQRLCGLNPMYSQCYFLPVDLPQFAYSNASTTRQTTTMIDPTSRTVTIQLCVVGKNKDHNLLARALPQLQTSSKTLSSVNVNVNVNVFGRFPSLPTVYDPYKDNTRSISAELIRQDDYVLFHQEIWPRCNVLLSLLDPIQHSAYFDIVYKKTSGVMAQAIAYQIPLILHSTLEAIYHGHLTAPVKVYDHDNNTSSSFVEALQEMIQLLTTQYS